MDFISNLIKRPISLVLNDSSSSAEHSQSPTKLAADCASRAATSKGTTPERPATPSFVIGGGGSSLFAAAMNTSFNANRSIDALNENGHYCELPAAASASPPAIPAATAPINLSTSPQQSGNCSANNTSSAIGELLVQINDNLNLADYNEQAAPQRPQANAVDITAVFNSSAELSPAATKMPANKMTPSPRSQASPAPANVSPVPAAGPTAFEFNSSLHRFCIDPELEAGFFVENPLPPNSNSNVPKASSTFAGMPAFDESNIPELTGALNADIEEQLKLTFEDGLIPTFTAFVNTDFNSTITKNEDIGNKTQLLFSHETDTAVSSDNETYAECQSYPDMLVNTTTDLTSSEPDREVSEIETYRSALNTTTTNAEVTEDTLNATMENVAEIEEERLEEKCSDAAIAESGLTEAEKQLELFEDEPMDVDISFALDAEQYETNVTARMENEIPKTDLSGNAVPLSLETESECAVVADVQNSQQSGESIAAEGEIDTQVAENHLTLSIAQAENAYSESPKQHLDLETEQSTYEVDQSKNIELSTNKSFVEADNSTPIAIVTLSAIEESYAAEDDTKVQQASTLALSNPHENEEVARTKNLANNSGSTLNSNLDMNSSSGSLKSTSSSNSSTFPVKLSASDLKHFPHSPTAADSEKKWSFLEKPTYAEDSSIKVKCQEFAVAEVIVTPCSPEMVANLSSPAANLNKTVDLGISNREKRASPEQENAAAALNGTFNADAVCSSVEVPTPTESMHSPDKPSRRTFNIQTTPINTTQMEAHAESASNSHESNANKRRTFTLPTTTQSAELNTNLEPMDIDDSVPMLDEVSKSPPIPTLQNCQADQLPLKLPAPARSPPIPTLQRNLIGDANFKMPLQPSVRSPPIPTLQKRPPTHAPTGLAAALELLSAKEQTHSNARDEKDVVAEYFATPSPIDDMFSLKSLTNAFGGFGSGAGGDASKEQEFPDEAFQAATNNLILNSSDFDYLLTKGNNSAKDVRVDRSSLLLKFDPLLGVPIPVNQPQQQQQQLQQILANNNNPCLSPPLEEDEQQQYQPGHNSRSFIVDSAKVKERSTAIAQAFAGPQYKRQPALKPTLLQATQPKKNARMSVDVIDTNDCNKPFENTNSQTDEKQSNFKMDELEKKIKNEVLKTGDIEKKLKDAEQREEALIKRITEKDKTISKMNGVIEAYEKAIAELIAEKEQLKQNYEKQLADVTTDRDSNYHHLTSLETTFSDLHVKYEKSKEMTSHLKASEESLLSEKRQNLENLRLQEQRYEKMKNHAMQQLEIANKKLESLTKEHAIETTKLKALLKKEEISRASINEQLQQKSRENSELVKICDELINGQGS